MEISKKKKMHKTTDTNIRNLRKKGTSQIKGKIGEDKYAFVLIATKKIVQKRKLENKLEKM